MSLVNGTSERLPYVEISLLVWGSDFGGKFDLMQSRDRLRFPPLQDAEHSFQASQLSYTAYLPKAKVLDMAYFKLL